MRTRWAVGLPLAGALVGLAVGVALLSRLPGRNGAGTALVLLATTAAGLALGTLIATIGQIAAWRRNRPERPPKEVAAWRRNRQERAPKEVAGPEPQPPREAAAPEPQPEGPEANGPPPEPEEPEPEPEPQPEPEAERNWPAPGDPSPGWHPDPAGGPGRRYWDGQAWTEHRWRERA